LSNGKAKDQIYLEEQATERTRSALKEITATLAPSGVRGNGCMGAAEFGSLFKKNIKGLCTAGARKEHQANRG
jgi:hypothetical protein